MDNRVSLYVAQKGKCAITGEILEINKICCHHKIPKALDGKDNYNNLIVIHENVHTLIHAESTVIIQKYINRIKPTSKQITKINKLRKMANKKAIAN